MKYALGGQIPPPEPHGNRGFMAKLAEGREITDPDEAEALGLRPDAERLRRRGAEVGSCRLCGQEMFRTEDDCWHPWNVARACPPEPEGEFDPAAWAAWRAAGNATGRPGREHFVPQETTVADGSYPPSETPEGAVER